MSVCQFCGKENRERATFCEGCGAPLEQRERPAPRARLKRRILIPVITTLAVCLAVFGWIGFNGSLTTSQEPPRPVSQMEWEAFAQPAARFAESRELGDLALAVRHAPAMAYIPPIVGDFLQRDENTVQDYLYAAEVLYREDFHTEALRVLAVGHDRLEDASLPAQIRAYWPRPCDVSETFRYFDPVARLLEKRWDTLEWEEAWQITYLCVGPSYLGVSLEEYDSHDSPVTFLPSVRYERFSAQDAAESVGFAADRYMLAGNVGELTGGAYVQTQEDLTAAIGVFLNVTALQMDAGAYVPSAAIARLPRLHTCYSLQYGDFAVRPGGDTGTLEPLAALDHLYRLGGRVPLGTQGLQSVTELDLCGSYRYSRSGSLQAVFRDGEPAWTAQQQGYSFETLAWRSAFDTWDYTSLTGLYAFPNVERLTLYNLSNLTDLEVLARLPALRALTLDRCTSLRLLTNLGMLTGLQELTIHQIPVESYSFVSGLVNLRVLSITVPVDAPPVAGPDLSRLEGLEVLSLNTGEPRGLSNLKALRSLSIGPIHDLTPLREMQGLEFLAVHSCADLSGMEALTGLRSLQISGGTPSNAQALQALPGLERLSVVGLSCAGAAELLKLTNVQAFTCHDLRGPDGLEALMNAIGASTGLTSLIMVPSYDTSPGPLVYSGERVNLEDILQQPLQTEMYDLTPYAEQLKNLGEMRSLRLDGMGLRSLDFLESMPRLQELNVCNNLIRSYAPLAALPELQALDIRGNLAGLEDLDGCLAAREVVVTFGHTIGFEEMIDP